MLQFLTRIRWAVESDLDESARERYNECYGQMDRRYARGQATRNYNALKREMADSLATTGITGQTDEVVPCWWEAEFAA